MNRTVWRQSVARYLLPGLPGTWGTTGTLVYAEPVGWLLRCIDLYSPRAASSFRVKRNVQFLAKPNTTLGGPYLEDLGHGMGRHYWPKVDSVEGASVAMAAVLEFMRADALPLFERVGSVVGYADEAQERAHEQPNDVNYQEELFYARLILGDVDAAFDAAAAVHRGAAVDALPWELDISTRVQTIETLARQNLSTALQALRDQADDVRRRLGLPPANAEELAP